MPLNDPVAVYTAASNVEAHMLCNFLIDAGVEAAVTDDISLAGLSWFGISPGLHKPQVWVDRANMERAGPVLEDYERQLAERRKVERADETGNANAIECLCEECGQRSSHPAFQRGTVQECPHCGAYIDVGGDEWPDDAIEEGWSEEAGE